MEKSLKAHSNYFPPRAIWVLGAGHFGQLACKRLIKRHPEALFRVVDGREEKLDAIKQELNLPVHPSEAIAYLAEANPAKSVWIIPAIPIHVAYRWILSRLAGADKRPMEIDVPGQADAQVPNPFRMNSKTLYASFATFVCPDNCNEPDEICTYTGEKRQGNLFDRLSQIAVAGFRVVVVRSLQLAPGVGGYPVSHLLKALSEIERAPGKYLIATSCRCHGVLDALEWKGSTE